MQLWQRIERKFDWLAMPGLIRYLAFLSGLAYALSWLNPSYDVYLAFDKSAILQNHEYWRLLSFPFASSGLEPSLFGLIFFVCAIQFSFMISDGLEEVWGVTRTTLFVLFGWLTLIAAAFLFDLSPFCGNYLFSTIFLAFAGFFPHVRIFLMMILPVPIWILAAFTLLGLGMTMLADPSQVVPILMCHASLLIWVVPGMWKQRGHLQKAQQKRRQFRAASMPANEAFHQCTVCGRTENDGHHIEFRVHMDGKEYCSEHTPAQ